MTKKKIIELNPGEVALVIKDKNYLNIECHENAPIVEDDKVYPVLKMITTTLCHLLIEDLSFAEDMVIDFVSLGDNEEV